jgi:hypothetical protein
MYVFTLLYFIGGPLSSEFNKFPVDLIIFLQNFFFLNTGLICIYGIVRALIGIIIFAKGIKKENVHFEIKNMLLTIPYLLASIYSIIMFIIRFVKWYETLHETDSLFFLITIFIGNYLWLYYWTALYNEKNISKEFIYIFCGLFPGFMYIIFSMFL